MRKIIYKLFNCLKLFPTKNEYWVHIKDININNSIDKRISEIEYKYELSYWMEHGEFRNHIVLDNNFTLVQGYINYIIAIEYGINIIPVIFIR